MGNSRIRKEYTEIFFLSPSGDVFSGTDDFKQALFMLFLDFLCHSDESLYSNEMLCLYGYPNLV